MRFMNPKPRPNPSPSPGQSAKKPRDWSSTLSTIGLILLAPIIALLITTFAFQSYQVDGQSMETTLQNNDRLIVEKIPRSWAKLTRQPYIPKRGDIIVFNQSGFFGDQGLANKQLIKRVIALPGERVVIKDGAIAVYNSKHPNGFNPDQSGVYSLASARTSGEVNLTVPPGTIFVCGDNRANSEDSRFFGPVSSGNIVGKLVLRVFPLSKAQSF